MTTVVPWPHSPNSRFGAKYRMSNETTAPGFSEEVGVRNTTTGWLMPAANFRRSSWLNVLDGSRKTIVAGFPANGSWVNAFAIANGYVLEVDVVDGIEDPELHCGQYVRFGSGCHIGGYL